MESGENEITIPAEEAITAPASLDPPSMPRRCGAE